MEARRSQAIILAQADDALTQLCGISIVERLLRTLQRLGITHAHVVTDYVASLQKHLSAASWARASITVSVGNRLEQIANAEETILLLNAAYYDRRLLAALLAQGRRTVLIDSAPPPAVQPLLSSSSETAREYFCRAALVDAAWLSKHAEPQQTWSELATAAEAGTVALLDANQQPAYVPDMRRAIRPVYFPAPTPENSPLAERLILNAAQNGTLDLPAMIHGPIETAIIARLCRTKITPNQITLFTAFVSAGVAVLFASGQLVTGTLLALIVGILDGLDGKQARVKVETTPLGKREHVLDYVLELSWWTALAYYFRSSGEVPHAFALLALLVGADWIDRAAKSVAKKHTGRNLDDAAPIDRFVRLIGGRRNIYIWMLAAGLILRRADEAFVALCWWGAVTAAVHVLRASWIKWQRVGARRESIAH